MNYLLHKIKTIIKTPTPESNPTNLISSTLKLVLLFSVFYFAVFKFNARQDNHTFPLIYFDFEKMISYHLKQNYSNLSKFCFLKFTLTIH